MSDGIHSEIDKLRQRADQLERLKSEFPDIHEHHTRWRKLLVSRNVNAAPEKVRTKHGCGCCNDSPLYACFYVERHGEVIYADPPEIFIGEKNPYHYDMDDEPYDNWSADWEDDVRKHVGDIGVEMLRPLSPLETQS